MSETENLVDAVKMTPAKKPAPANSKRKSTPRIRLSAGKAPKQEIPPGKCACYVAIPGRVSRGNGTGKANAGEMLLVGVETADELELRGLACRDADEAKGLFSRFKRKEEKRIADAIDVAAKRHAARERAKREQLAAAKIEWRG